MFARYCNVLLPAFITASKTQTQSIVMNQELLERALQHQRVQWFINTQQHRLVIVMRLRLILGKEPGLHRHQRHKARHHTLLSLGAGKGPRNRGKLGYSLMLK